VSNDEVVVRVSPKVLKFVAGCLALTVAFVLALAIDLWF